MVESVDDAHSPSGAPEEGRRLPPDEVGTWHDFVVTGYLIVRKASEVTAGDDR